MVFYNNKKHSQVRVDGYVTLRHVCQALRAYAYMYLPCIYRLSVQENTISLVYSAVWEETRDPTPKYTLIYIV